MTLEENIINVQAHLMGLSERVGRLEYQVRSLVVGPQILERVRVLESMVKELIIELRDAEIIDEPDEEDDDDEEE